MLGEKHREAEDLSAAAATAIAEGQNAEAEALYARAAQCEEAALAQVPPDKIRTRSILSVSVASLLYKAQRLAHAEKAIFCFLGSGGLETWADRQLHELMQVVSDERLHTTCRPCERHVEKGVRQ